uniref:Uncharacterized protein n=1 Tax=Helianthus annuus TaxID=4232 RepID=A0A251UYB3_HELAN
MSTQQLRYMYRLMKRRVHSLHVDTGSWPSYKVKRMEVELLGLWAIIESSEGVYDMLKELFQQQRRPVLRQKYPPFRKHGKKVAVHTLTFAYQEGVCFCNGAEKTTTLFMLTVYLTDGTAFIFGQDMRLNPRLLASLT